MAFPTLPALSSVPTVVDADRWLQAYDGQRFARNVKANGRVVVADTSYDVKTALAKQAGTLRVDAAANQFVVEANGHEVQRVAIKGLGVGRLPFATFVERLCADARTWRAATYGPVMQHRLLFR